MVLQFLYWFQRERERERERERNVLFNDSLNTFDLTGFNPDCSSLSTPPIVPTWWAPSTPPPLYPPDELPPLPPIASTWWAPSLPLLYAPELPHSPPIVPTWWAPPTPPLYPPDELPHSPLLYPPDELLPLPPLMYPPNELPHSTPYCTHLMSFPPLPPIEPPDELPTTPPPYCTHLMSSPPLPPPIVPTWWAPPWVPPPDRVRPSRGAASSSQCHGSADLQVVCTFSGHSLSTVPGCWNTALRCFLFHDT